MCQSNNCNENNKGILHNEVYTNIQTGEVLDWERVEGLKDNAMLKVRPELWIEWDFKKNDESGFDIWKMTKGSEKKVWWYCPICDDIYPQLINRKVRGVKCSICNGHYVTSANSLASLNPDLAKQWHPTKNGELTSNDVTCHNSKKVWWLGNCGHEWEATVDNRSNGKNCPYCAHNPKVLKGFNDMWTTDLSLARLLASPENGYKFTKMSNVKVDWICPDCGELIKDKEIAMVRSNGLSCPLCSDGRSYPEKLMSNLLNELGVNYINDRTFEWSDNKRYDFYLMNYATIVEIHGSQHYKGEFEKLGGRTIKEEQENDKYKKDLALRNGISKYIEIDARISDINYIKTNILNSMLNSLFDLSNIDWNQIDNNSKKSTHLKILELWNDGLTVREISKIVNYHESTIDIILRKWRKAGKCNYGKNHPVVQLSLTGEVIKKWDNIKTASKELNIKYKYIANCCLGKSKTSHGYIWKYKK